MSRKPNFDYSTTKNLFPVPVRIECLTPNVLKDFIDSLRVQYLKTINNLVTYPAIIEESEKLFRDNGRYIKEEDLKEGQDPYLDWRFPDKYWNTPQDQEKYTNPRVTYKGARESLAEQGTILKEIEDKILFFTSHYVDMKNVVHQ